MAEFRYGPAVPEREWEMCLSASISGENVTLPAALPIRRKNDDGFALCCIGLMCLFNVLHETLLLLYLN